MLVDRFTLPAAATVQDAIACIDRSGRVNIALLVDDAERLVNTISDGDVRRGILAGVKLFEPVTALLGIKAATPHPLPVTALEGTDDETLLELMKARAVRQIPIVDAGGRVVDVVTLHDLLPEEPRALQALVMAGGQGMRMRPLTDELPKPMLPVGGRPLMEVIIDQLRDVGVRKVNIATHYQAQKIVDHFGDGTGFGVDIAYVNEQQPLGTGGALGLMDRPHDPMLVINGDILTDIDFRAMHRYHVEHHATMTVAVRRYEVHAAVRRGRVRRAADSRPAREAGDRVFRQRRDLSARARGLSAHPRHRPLQHDRSGRDRSFATVRPS